jgi:hypothetical protein
MENHTICSFCLNIWDIDTIVCPTCHEYKGIMLLNAETLNYLGEDAEEYADYL